MNSDWASAPVVGVLPQRGTAGRCAFALLVLTSVTGVGVPHVVGNDGLGCFG